MRFKNNYFFLGIFFYLMAAVLAFITLFLLFFPPFASAAGTTFFVVEYESYTWSLCGPDGTCLAINCSFEGCTTPGMHFFVKTLGEVRELVNHNGTEHLSAQKIIMEKQFDTQNDAEMFIKEGERLNNCQEFRGIYNCISDFKLEKQKVENNGLIEQCQIQQIWN